MKTTAAVVDRPDGPFSLQELELDALRDDEVLVEIAATGICHTDLTAAAGGFPTPFPVVLGHEGAGTVVAVGSGVRGVAPGRRVAMSFGSCGVCRTCAHGHPAHCEDFFARNFAARRADGSMTLGRANAQIHSQFFGQSSFAAHAVCPERSVIPVDDDVPFAVLAPMGCGIQTGVGTVLNALRPGPGASLAVFGAGAVGLAAVMAARLSGCSPIVAVDVHAHRLALALELGATHVVDATGADPVEMIRTVTRGGADFTLECSGRPPVLLQAIESLGLLGTCAVVGVPPAGNPIELDANLLLGPGRTVRGVVEGDSLPSLFIPRLIELWRAGSLPVERLVRTFPFDQINDAVAEMERGAVVKPVLLLPREERL